MLLLIRCGGRFTKPGCPPPHTCEEQRLNQATFFRRRADLFERCNGAAMCRTDSTPPSLDEQCRGKTVCERVNTLAYVKSTHWPSHGAAKRVSSRVVSVSRLLCVFPHIMCFHLLRSQVKDCSTTVPGLVSV